jgi:hypothetical protein
MSCLRLSLQRCAPRRAPHAPSNAERLRVFRLHFPQTPGNAHPWAFAERYAREQSPQPVIPFSERRGF